MYSNYIRIFGYISCTGMFITKLIKTRFIPRIFIIRLYFTFNIIKSKRSIEENRLSFLYCKCIVIRLIIRDSDSFIIIVNSGYFSSNIKYLLWCGFPYNRRRKNKYCISYRNLYRNGIKLHSIIMNIRRRLARLFCSVNIFFA